MRIICVDDEELILQLTLAMCKELPQVKEAVGFTKASEALGWLEENEADIALLDINMPDMDGLSLAAEIKTVHPDTSIVFLTGYSEYAVEAFAMHASGYLLKPISPERLSEELDWAMNGKHEEKTSHITVKTFGEFDILVDGKLVTFTRQRAKELLAYLVDRQGSSITRANAFAVLWETGVYDRKMQKQLDVIIRSLRDTLREYGIEEIFEVSGGALRICPEYLDCDLYRFLDGDIDAVNSYRGEYMSAYSWASLTEAYMSRIK